jgi:hypothetical protein
MDVKFSEQGAGRDWSAKVLHGGVHVGTIRLSSDLAFYRYFAGPGNDFIYTMDEHDLGTLKARITGAITRPQAQIRPPLVRSSAGAFLRFV